MKVKIFGSDYFRTAKLFLGLTLLLGAFSPFIPQVIASDIVQTIPSNNGRTKQLSPIPILLAPGSGVSISFSASGETLEKVWLDNPSFVVIDADGCLSGLSSNQSNCANSTQFLHLRRINDLSIQGLPKTHSSLLTVVTKGSNGRNLYLFRITKASQAKKLVFEIVPTTTPSSVEPLVLTTQRITQGMKVAFEKKLLKQDGELTQKIHNFIGYLESGIPKLEAANQAGISLSVVQRLEALGR